MRSRRILCFMACVVFAALGSPNAHAAGIDRSFYEQYFAERHNAILFPVPSPRSPGDVISLPDFTVEATLDDCLIDPARRPQLIVESSPRVSINQRLYTGSIDLNVAVNSGFRANAKVNVKRSDSLAETDEKQLRTIQHDLSISTMGLTSIVRPKCAAYFNSTDSRIMNGKLFVLNSIFAFEGELKVATSLDISFDAGVSIKASDFLQAAGKIKWIADILDRLNFGAEASISAGQKSGTTAIERFNESNRARAIHSSLSRRVTSIRMSCARSEMRLAN